MKNLMSFVFLFVGMAACSAQPTIEDVEKVVYGIQPENKYYEVSNLRKTNGYFEDEFTYKVEIQYTATSKKDPLNGVEKTLDEFFAKRLLSWLNGNNFYQLNWEPEVRAGLNFEVKDIISFRDTENGWEFKNFHPQSSTLKNPPTAPSEVNPPFASNKKPTVKIVENEREGSLVLIQGELRNVDNYIHNYTEIEVTLRDVKTGEEFQDQVFLGHTLHELSLKYENSKRLSSMLKIPMASNLSNLNIEPGKIVSYEAVFINKNFVDPKVEIKVKSTKRGRI